MGGCGLSDATGPRLAWSWSTTTPAGAGERGALRAAGRCTHAGLLPGAALRPASPAAPARATRAFAHGHRGVDARPLARPSSGGRRRSRPRCGVCPAGRRRGPRERGSGLAKGVGRKGRPREDAGRGAAPDGPWRRGAPCSSPASTSPARCPAPRRG